MQLKPARRTFLAGVAAVACAPKKVVAPPAGDRWSAIRGEFLLAHDTVHLSALLLASHPRVVREAIEKHRRALDENPVRYFHEMEGTWRMHEAAAKYMAVPREEIALTDSTTMGLGVVYGGLQLSAGDEILVSTHDHFAHHEAIRLAASRTGAVVKKVPLYQQAETATDAEMIDSAKKAITDKTRIVALTWVHSSTGVRVPIKEIAELSHRADALVIVDGVHGFGVEADDISSLGCDVFIAGCHKWIFGPRGTGVVWARPSAWARMAPTIPAFTADTFESWKKGVPPPKPTAFSMTPGGFHSWEHRWALPAAFEFHLSIGKEDIRDRTRALNKRLKDGLRALPKVRVLTPNEPSAGITCFDVKGRTPEQVVDHLRARKIVGTTTPYEPSYPRLTPAIYNSDDDVDRAIRAVAELA